MSKHKHIKKHHLYLSIGGMLAVASLLVALNYGLSSAQSEPPPPMPPPPMDQPAPMPPATMPPPMPPMDQPPTTGTYNPAPLPPIMPPAGCGSGMYWNGTGCMPSGTTGTTNMPPPAGCGANMMWNGNSCVPSGTTSGTMPINMPACAPGVMPTAAAPCMMNSTGTNPSNTNMPAGGCGANMYWNGIACMQGTSGTMVNPTPPPGGCPQSTPIWCSSQNRCTVTQLECAPPTTGTMPSNMPACAPGVQPRAAAPCMMNSTGTNPSSNMQACPPGVQPTAALPCMPAGTTNNAYNGAMNMVECPSLGGRRVTSQECGNATPVCPPGQQSSMTNPCRMEGSNTNMQPGTMPGTQGGDCYNSANQERFASRECTEMRARNMQNGGMPYDPMRGAAEPRTNFNFSTTCPAEMQQCPDRYNPANTMCMPRKMYDFRTQAMKDATCADFQAPAGDAQMGPHMMGPNMGPNMGPGMQGMPGMMGPMPYAPFGPAFGPNMPGFGTRTGVDPGFNVDPCVLNPYDPFCQAGFNFDAIKQSTQFDQNAFDPAKFEVRNLKQELRNLKRESKEWARDAKQVRRQLVEMSRQSSGFACPVAVEVDALAKELESAASTVDALSDASSKEDIQKGVAMRAHVNGDFNQETGEQIPGIRSKLYGGPMDPETGMPTPGKMQGLDICRQVSGMIVGACEAARHIQSELDDLKEVEAPAEVVKAFEEAAAQLDQRCKNPFEVLKSEGVSFDTLSEPWYPDPSVCAFQGVTGPFPMGAMEGPGMGPQGGFGGFDGPMEMPEECMPPVMRYLGVDSIMRALQEARYEGDAHFESMNACKMFEMGKKFLDKGGRNGPPPSMRGLIQKGLAACESGDSETIEAIKAQMLSFAQGGRESEQFADLVDIDSLVEDKLNEKLAELQGDEEGSDEDVALLRKQVDELTKNLNDAQKTILALKEDLADMTAKVAGFNLDGNIIGNLAQLPNEKTQQFVATTIGQLADQATALKDAKSVTGELDTLIDETMNTLIQSPPSSAVLGDIKESFTALQSYAASGATKAELAAKVKEELGDVAELNGGKAELEAKVAQNLVASVDTADLSQWYAVPALIAKQNSFVSGEFIRPSEPETRCAAVTRVARILEKAGELEIDEDDTRPVAGAPVWCVPFIHALQNENVPFVRNFSNPNGTADRLDIAVLMHDALGDKLPDAPNLAEYVTPDIANLTPAQQMAIAEMRYNGIMDTTDGTNFNPNGDFNRAQNLVVTVKAYEAVSAGTEGQGE